MTPFVGNSGRSRRGHTAHPQWGAPGVRAGVPVARNAGPEYCLVTTCAPCTLHRGVRFRPGSTCVQRASPFGWFVNFFGRTHAPVAAPRTRERSLSCGGEACGGRRSPSRELLPAVRQARLFPCSWFKQTPFLCRQAFWIVSFWVSFGVIKNDPR